VVRYSFTANLDSSHYHQGDYVSFCYWLDPSDVPYTVRLTQTAPKANARVMGQWNDTGGGDCLYNQFTVDANDAAAGGFTLFFEAFVGGTRVGYYTVSATVDYSVG
jgi:hypothetical protein